MRLTLGKNVHERVVRKYMKEMGEQWKGAGITFDYAIARGQTGLPSSEGQLEGNGGDAELASWVWRNLFAGRGGDAVHKPIAPGELAMQEVELLYSLEQSSSGSDGSSTDWKVYQIRMCWREESESLVLCARRIVNSRPRMELDLRL